MLSFLASFMLHLLCNEILLNSQADVQTQKRNSGMPVKEWQESVRVRALFKIHWFLSAAEMQKHSWEVQDQIIITAVLALPKGEVAFASPGFLLVMKSCPLLARALTLVKLCWTWFRRLILPYPLCLLGQFSTVLPSWKSSGPGRARGRRQKCMVRSAQLWADGGVELLLFQKQ